MTRVVAMGGGTGLPVLLRGLKAHTHHITAIVTVTDDGGSSGRLRGELGILPPGDIRNCLVALAGAEPLMQRLFQHRFTRGTLAGHAFGNLFIGALTELFCDFQAAVRAASHVLRIHGEVLPSTREQVQVCAELADGTVVEGETAVASAGVPIRRVFLQPADVQPVPEALRALESADVVVMGPGSLFTSVLPNLLVRGVAEAVRRSRAEKVFVVNVMTQPGETDGFTAADHVRAVEEHVGAGLIDRVVVNTGAIEPECLARYRLQGAEPVRADVDRLRAAGLAVTTGDLVDQDKAVVRHDPEALAAAVLAPVRQESRV